MEIGVVVFGAGIAGKVRVRDVGAAIENGPPGITWKLHGFVSRYTYNHIQQFYIYYNLDFLSFCLYPPPTKCLGYIGVNLSFCLALCQYFL